MKPVKRPDHNMVYKGPTPPDIGDLSCQRVEPGHIRSHWRPSEDELAILNAGGVIELDIHTEPIPPLAINVDHAVEGEEENQFRQRQPEPPV